MCVWVCIFLFFAKKTHFTSRAIYETELGLFVSKAAVAPSGVEPQAWIRSGEEYRPKSAKTLLDVEDIVEISVATIPAGMIRPAVSNLAERVNSCIAEKRQPL